MNHKILYINLSSGSCETRDMPEALIRGYIGGRGINSALLLENTGAGLDPLSPENPLIFGAGLNRIGPFILPGFCFYGLCVFY